ncbi:MAG: GcvT family protein, partial [Sciscionella sp.]
MAAQPRVVIIGAGIVGCALADEITARGWCDVTVLEQGPLFATGGSSSHAPGLVFQTMSCRTMSRLARYTVRKYSSLSLQGKSCFTPVGGLEIATTVQRMAELTRRHGWATSWGIESFLRSPEECVALHSLLDPDKVLGGFHIPSDGLANPLRAAQAQGQAAIARGARFLAGHQVVGIDKAQGKVVSVCTEGAVFRADVVISAVGMWGPKIGALVDLEIPLVPMAHQYAKTTPLTALAGANSARNEASKPILRHQDADLYYREHGDRIGIGAYGHRPMPITAEEILSVEQAETMPSEMAFTAEDFEQSWAESQRLLPCLGDAKIEHGVNGLFSFTPDGNPLLGEHPDLGGFWVAEAVWITHSAGVAAAMADWIVEGQPKIDLHGCELSRFDEVALAPSTVLARSCQSFVEVYDAIHPRQPSGEPRGLRTSPFHERAAELGAVFLESGGWERAQWFEANANLPEIERVPERNDWAARYYSPIVGAEALAVRNRVGLFDMTSLRRLELSGPGALTFLQTMTSNQLDRKVGAVTYTLMLAEDGGIRSDLTVARTGQQRFQVGINSPVDRDWLLRHLPLDGSVNLRDITAGTCCIGLWGPRARAVLQPLTRTDFSHKALGYFRNRHAYIGDVPVTAMRLSYVGELGWELYTSADLGRRLWDTLWEAGQPHGVLAAGRGAFSSMRLEKGYRLWGTDMTAEHDPFESGVDFAVRMDKGYFIGRDGLRGKSADSIARKLVPLLIEQDYQVVMGSEPVYADGAPVGYVTSADYGFSIGSPIAYA